MHANMTHTTSAQPNPNFQAKQLCRVYGSWFEFSFICAAVFNSLMQYGVYQYSVCTVGFSLEQYSNFQFGAVYWSKFQFEAV